MSLGNDDQYTSLTKKQDMILTYFKEHREEICYISLNALAKKLKVSEVSILRLCRKIGYDGFLDLKEKFRCMDSLEITSMDSFQEQEENLNVLGKLNEEFVLKKSQFYQQICQMEHANLNELFRLNSLEKIFECAKLLIHAKEVVIFGHDASKILADYLAHRLNYLRIKANAVKLGDDATVKSMLSRIEAKDCAVFFSFPPYHTPIKNAARYVQYRKGEVITFSDSLSSPVVIEDSINFLCPTGAKFFYNTLTGPIAMIGLLTSCIAVELGDRMNEILEEEQAMQQFFKDENAEF